MVCSYNLVTMFIPLNSFETWVAFYDGETESLFLGVKTICEILNMILFLVYIVILMMKDKRERERIQLLNAQLQKANEQLHEFAQEKELMGETKERNRLAREIHDTLGHILTGISVGIDAVLVLMDIAPDKAKEQLEGIGDTARRGLQDVRRSVRKLKPDALERMSLNNAIHQMIEDMSKVTNTKIYFVSYMVLCAARFGEYRNDCLLFVHKHYKVIYEQRALVYCRNSGDERRHCRRDRRKRPRIKRIIADFHGSVIYAFCYVEIESARSHGGDDGKKYIPDTLFHIQLFKPSVISCENVLISFLKGIVKREYAQLLCHILVCRKRGVIRKLSAVF